MDKAVVAMMADGKVFQSAEGLRHLLEALEKWQVEMVESLRLRYNDQELGSIHQMAASMQKDFSWLDGRLELLRGIYSKLATQLDVSRGIMHREVVSEVKPVGSDWTSGKHWDRLVERHQHQQEAHSQSTVPLGAVDSVATESTFDRMDVDSVGVGDTEEDLDVAGNADQEQDVEKDEIANDIENDNDFDANDDNGNDDDDDDDNDDLDDPDGDDPGIGADLLDSFGASSVEEEALDLFAPVAVVESTGSPDKKDVDGTSSQNVLDLDDF